MSRPPPVELTGSSHGPEPRQAHMNLDHWSVCIYELPLNIPCPVVVGELPRVGEDGYQHSRNYGKWRGILTSGPPRQIPVQNPIAVFSSRLRRIRISSYNSPRDPLERLTSVNPTRRWQLLERCERIPYRDTNLSKVRSVFSCPASKR